MQAFEIGRKQVVELANIYEIMFLFQKLKILMNFMGPAWLDFKPYKILSELPCEVL